MVNLAKSCQVNLPTTAVLHGGPRLGFIQAANGREGQYITQSCLIQELCLIFDIVFISSMKCCRYVECIYLELLRNEW